MRLPTRSFLSSVSLAGAVALVLVASLGGASGYFGGALLLLLAAAGIGFLRVDRRAPTEAETQGFVASVLRDRGYAGAYRCRDFSQITSPGIEPGNVRVKFRGVLAFHEDLYQPAAPSAEVFKGFSPRKIEWLRKTADMLERELGSEAAGLAGRAPTDPYRVTYVAVRKPGGWTLPFSGSAWAMWRDGAWLWDVRNLSQSIDTLVVHGKPISAFPAAVELAGPDGKAWLTGCLESWREYENEITALQKRIDDVRAARARDAMGGFFHDVQAGTTYEGTGESLTQQVAPARYFLEFASANAATRAVTFTLRSERRWQAARAFSGAVSFDAGAAHIAIHARTSAADAQADAGPLLSVAAAFDMDLRWIPGTPPHLEGSAVDLTLRLAQVAPDALGKVLEQVQAREREIAAAIAPGGVYRGSVAVAGVERPLKVEFLPSTEFAGGAARVESGDWSAMFRVVTSGDALEAGYDVALQSTVRVEATRPAADAGKITPTPEMWSRVLLRLATGRFSGMVVSGDARLPVAQLARTPTSPA